MGKKREHMTVEQCKSQVEEEIPYEVGKGTQCVQRRSRRLKELYKRHGHDVVNPMQVGGFFGGSAAGGDQRPKMGTAMRNTGAVDVPHFRGQRVA